MRAPQPLHLLSSPGGDRRLLLFPGRFAFDQRAPRLGDDSPGVQAAAAVNMHPCALRCLLLPGAEMSSASVWLPESGAALEIGVLAAAALIDVLRKDLVLRWSTVIFLGHRMFSSG